MCRLVIHISFTTTPVGNATISAVGKSWVYTGFEGGSGSTVHVVVLHHSLAEYALCIILGAEWSSLRPLLYIQEIGCDHEAILHVPNVPNIPNQCTICLY